MGDLTIQCVDCGNRFVWTERDQCSFKERGWSAPKRCPDCRARKRSERESEMLMSWWRKPLYRYGLLSSGASLFSAIVIWQYVLREILLAWLIAVTLVTVLMYVYDKMIAGSGWMRVPEAVLLTLAFTGGTLGALAAMRIAHHKTIKESFRRKFWLIVLAQVAVVVAYFFLLKPRLGG